jgi:hypothetical protein
MLKTFHPKYALLSLCASTCLVGAVQASEIKSQPDFTIIPPNIHKIACGSDGSELTYRVINNTGNPNITLLDIEVDQINPADSFPDNNNVVTIKGGTCEIGKYTGKECTIILEVNTFFVDSPCEDIIDRTLEIDVNTWTHDFYAPIYLEVDTLGNLDEFTLLAPSIFNTAPTKEAVNAPPGYASIPDNAGYTDEHGFGTTLIEYREPHARLYQPEEELTKAANEDLEAAYYSMLNKQYDGGCNSGNTIAPSLGSGANPPIASLNPGLHCFYDNNQYHYPVTIRGNLHLTGGPGDTHTFIIDFNDADKDDIVFDILSGATMTMDPYLSADNVFFIVKGSTEMQGGSSIIRGNILSIGAFEFEDSASSVQGRILILGKERHSDEDYTPAKYSFDCEHEHAYICLYGNYIIDPTVPDPDL